MIRAWAEGLTHPPIARAVVLVAVAIGLGAGALATRVDHDDDLLAFLPEDDAEVAAFRTINKAFGGLDVALVGIEADNPLDPELFKKLRDVTQVLNDADEVKFALSLANVNDFRPSADGGIETDLLVRDVPNDIEGQRLVKKKVMSRDLVVGQLIAPGGKAAILYAFGAYDGDPRAFATKVRSEVLARFPPRSVYFGGAPFVSTYIFDTTQSDLRRLTPWAVAVIVLLVFFAFRDVRGVILALAATGFGIVVALGLMVATGQRYNIVLSSMPVILFSVGSAYGIHVLARYYAIAAVAPPREALVKALVEVGPTVAAAAGTTMVGLLSFLTMDIAPLRSFGLFTAAGIGAALLSSLTFVPATVVVFGIKGNVGQSRAGAWGRIVRTVERHRWGAITAMVVALGVGGLYTAKVDTRMDQTAFFAQQSEPARADRFLRRHFGGSTFIQVHAAGDFASPAVLRAWAALADDIEALPHVSNVQHIGQVIAQLNDALAAERRIPDTDAQVKLLYRFLAGMPAVDQLVTADREQAVMHIKVGTQDLDEMDATLAAVEGKLGQRLPTEYAVVSSADVPEARTWLTAFLTQRVATLARQADVPLTDEALARVSRALSVGAPEVEMPAVVEHLEGHLLSPESLVDLPDRSLARRIAEVLAPAGDPDAQMAALRQVWPTADAETLDDLIYVADSERPSAARRARADAWGAVLRKEGLPQPGGEAGERFVRRIRDTLITGVVGADVAVERPTGAVGRIDAQVTGLPVLHRGLSRSARRNQISSLAVALGLVIVLLCLLFRSLRFGLAAAVPTVCTLAVVYGAMGALGVHLDIGTSMLASLIIGAGVDYAVHLVAAHRFAVRQGSSEPLVAAVAATGTAIWTNALMVAAGFYLLTLGEARTLQNVGGLTAAAMLVAAISTFGVVPALLPRSVKIRRTDVG